MLADAIVARMAGCLHTEALLDRPALAARLGVSERTVSSMVAKGELPQPLLHTSGVARWSWAQVVKFLESRQGKQRRRGRGRHAREHVAHVEGKGGGRG
jgi:predicted DNA-binding transcriptional regulator AlpA